MSDEAYRYDLYDQCLLSAEPQALTRSDGDLPADKVWRLKSGSVEEPATGCVHDILDFDGIKRLRVWHDIPGKVVVSYDETRVEWDATRQQIVLDLSRDLAIPVGVILERVVAPLALMLLKPSMIALHASAIADKEGRAWIFIGNSGAGKSTTALELMRRGLTLLADDLVLVDTNTMELIAATPTLRLFDQPESVPEAVQNQLVMPGANLNKYWYQLADRKERRRRFEIAGIFSLQPIREQNSSSIQELQGTESIAQVLAQAFDLTHGSSQFRARRFQKLCTLARNSPVLQLSYYPGDREKPAQVAKILRYLNREDVQ